MFHLSTLTALPRSTRLSCVDCGGHSLVLTPRRSGKCGVCESPRLVPVADETRALSALGLAPSVAPALF
jgi:hypothetical protein